MRVLNAVQRIIMLLLLIPVLIICLDALLQAFGARRGNPIVREVDDAANMFILEPFRTVFPKQSDLQDALVTLAAIGLLVLLVVFLFRALRSMVGTKSPKQRPAPSRKPAKAEKAESAAAKPAPAETKPQPAAPATSGATETKAEAPVNSTSSSAEDDSHSTSG